NNLAPKVTISGRFGATLPVIPLASGFAGQVVVEGEGVATVGVDGNVALPGDPGELAGPGVGNDGVGTRLGAPGGGRRVLEQEGPLPALQAANDQLDGAVAGRALLGDRHDRLAHARGGELARERLGDPGAAELEPLRYLGQLIEWRRFVGVHGERRCRSHGSLGRRGEQVVPELVPAIPLLLKRRGMAKTILEVGELAAELG